jgi:SAM-dependent methyltransferase
METYSEQFYQTHQDGARRSARAIVPLVLKLLQPKSVVDVGCGIGVWLSVFKEHGVEDIYGVDGEYVNRQALKIPVERFLPFDLTKPLALQRQFDLVVSLEVAEHLPAECAATFVQSLVKLGPVVLFSAAIPFQGGVEHVNEQWPDYWARLFAAADYVALDCLRRQVWQNENVEWFYAQNILLFVRRAYIAGQSTLQRECERNAGLPHALVHPKKYLDVAKQAHKLSPAVQDFAATLARVQPFTMVSTEALVDLAHQVRAVLTYNIPGDLVECGAWRGGASFLMADLLRQAGATDRKVWLCDSFAGIPPPQEVDGQAAQTWAENKAGQFDNLCVSLEEVQQSAAQLGLTAYTEFVKGYFEQTLPAARARIGPIAILRIDCDWYASVRCCLENLYEQVVEGGFVIFDDYHTFDGCARAVHEFLGARGLAHRLEHVAGTLDGYEHYYGALFRKGSPTWKRLYPYYLVTHELLALIPAGETFILADQAEFGEGIAPGRQQLPFVERAGVYYGPPPDDETAIAEFKRLQQAGARFMVFGWPAFWWLDHYREFHRHLRAEFRCVLENDRLVVFDLRKKD